MHSRAIEAGRVGERLAGWKLDMIGVFSVKGAVSAIADLGSGVVHDIKRLGKPDSALSKDDNNVYTWEAVHTDQNVGNECVEEMHQETFVIDDRYPSGESDSDHAVGTCLTHYSISHQRCMLKVFTGKDDNITGYAVNGVTEACAVIAKRIDLSYSFVPTPLPWPF